MLENSKRFLLAALALTALSPPAVAQSSQVDKINKWFDQSKEDEKKRSEYWKNLKTGPLQTPGEIEKAGKMQKAGDIQKAGAVQIPQGWKAIKSSELPCQKRYAISGDTLFEFDRDTLTPKAVSTLNLLVVELKKQNTHPITVEGHTDSIGTDEYNQQLSFHRATRVKDWLIENKVFEKEALKVVAHGKRVPVAPNTNPDGTDNPAGRQLNRRVEIVVNTCVTLEAKKDDVAASPAVEGTASSPGAVGKQAAPGDEGTEAAPVSESSGDKKAD
jgi:outer membrane protein OmpA-like peptidoglycan-associated protein